MFVKYQVVSRSPSTPLFKGTPKNKLPNFVGWARMPILDD
jgi:hypothetical protein